MAAIASLERPWPLTGLAQPEPDPQVTVIWSPQPGPQAHAASCPVHELFYGGARGSGKSELLIGLWADHANKYGRYAQGILLRRRPVGMPSSTRSSATDPAGSSHRRRRRQRFRKV